MSNVSIIVCTRNRASNLSKLFKYWDNVDQSALKELIFVNNGSSDNTSELLENYRTSTHLPVKVFHENKIGVSNARNCGLGIASGPYIGMTDDDCYPDSNFVTAIAKTFQNNSEIGYVGGRVLLYDHRDLPITIITKETRESLSEYSFIKPGIIHGANFAFRKEVINKIGRFDPLFGPGGKLYSAEDTEFIARASWAGFKGIFEPDVVVYHHHGRRTSEDARNLIKAYATGRGAYYTKYLLNRGSHKAYRSHWVSELKRDFDKQRLLEIKGAIQYLWYISSKLD